MRVKHGPKVVRRNPLEPNQGLLLKELLGKKKISEGDDTAMQVDALLQALPAEKQSLTPDSIRMMFPHRGKREKDWSNERIQQAMLQYDLVARLSPVLVATPPGAPLESLAEQVAVATRLSLDEARTMLQRMRNSLTEAQGPSRGDKPGETFKRAMQPSSAITRNVQVRKLYNYSGPEMLVSDPNNTVLVISPEITTPRVMTWRRSTHIDADLATKDNGDLLPLLATALKSTLFWLGEKPGRTKNGKIWLYRIGSTHASLLWDVTLDSVLSIEQIQANWNRRQQIQSTAQAAEDVDLYVSAMNELFGTPNLGRKRRGRPPKTQPFVSTTIPGMEQPKEQPTATTLEETEELYQKASVHAESLGEAEMRKFWADYLQMFPQSVFKREILEKMGGFSI